MFLQSVMPFWRAQPLTNISYSAVAGFSHKYIMFYMAVQYWDTKPYCSETYTLKWRLERFSHKMQSLPSLGEVTHQQLVQTAALKSAKYCVRVHSHNHAMGKRAKLHTVNSTGSLTSLSQLLIHKLLAQSAASGTYCGCVPTLSCQEPQR